MHICFGYGVLVAGRPAQGYSFLTELKDSAVRQISIETAQPKLDCSVLRPSPAQAIILGVLDLSTQDGGDAGDRRRADPPRAAVRRAVARHRRARLRLKYLPRDVAFAKLKALVDGTRIVRAELAR